MNKKNASSSVSPSASPSPSRETIEVDIDQLGCKLNLGCGDRKLDGFINIDKRDEVDPDRLWDIEAGIPMGDNTVDLIFCADFLEHIHSDNVFFVVGEIYRVLKPGGIFEFFIPSTDGRGAFQDPTHRSFWNLNTWLYFTEKNHRELYRTEANFNIHILEDKLTNERLKIIHTHGILTANKEVTGG